MAKKLVRLTEGDLHRIVKESVSRILKESQEINAENVGRQFINFIEKYHGGVLLQTIVDCESGNEVGAPISPLPTIIPEFEEAMGQKMTSEMRQEIKRAYNEWWYYAQSQLMPEEDESTTAKLKI